MTHCPEPLRANNLSLSGNTVPFLSWYLTSSVCRRTPVLENTALSWARNVLGAQRVGREIVGKPYLVNRFSLGQLAC